jgi:quercetin dioxygenase-like cupin family protein
MKSDPLQPVSDFSRRFRVLSEQEIAWSKDLAGSPGRVWKILFEEASGKLRIMLEEYDSGSAFHRRVSPHGWEGIFVCRGSLMSIDQEFTESYFLLSPGQETKDLTAGKTGCRSLRTMRNASFLADSLTETLNVGRDPLVEPQHYSQLSWHEIPQRRPGDPGSLVAEISRSSSGTFIASLLNCRPGWVLEEHQHSSDVFTFCMRGGGVLETERRFDFQEGQLVIIPRGILHRFETGMEGAFMLVLVVD